MDWAQEAFPAFFPSREVDRTEGPYIFRHYPSSANYIGIAGQAVYVLGPVSGGELLLVGQLTDFAARVYGDPRPVAPADAHAVRALLQAQFSASDAEIEAVKAQGFASWLDTQVRAPRSTSAVSWLTAQGYNSTARSKQFHTIDTPAQWAIWNQLWTAPDAVRMRMALALSEFFVISSTGFNCIYLSYATASFWDRLVSHAFGNFRALLESVTLSAAMGLFLSIIGSQKADGTGRQPDENYAREVMQLFSIGLYELNLDGTPRLDSRGEPIETYSSEDVSQLARVFTGYTFAHDPLPPWPSDDPVQPLVPRPAHVVEPMRLNANSHSFEEVRFLGRVIPSQTNGHTALGMALDTLFLHPNVGPFFGRQMIQRLVTSNPSPGYVTRVARVFNDNGQGIRGDLKAVFLSILLDPEARDSASTDAASMGKLSEPMLRIAQFGRCFALPATLARWKGFPDAYGQQLPLRGPSVFNFFRPGHVPPGTTLAARGLVAPEFQIVGESTVAQYVNQLQQLARQGFEANVSDDVFSRETGNFVGTSRVSVPPDYANELPLASNAAVLVQRLNRVICAGRLPHGTQQIIIDALNETPVDETSSTAARLDRVAAAVLMVMSCPEYLVQR